MFKTLFFTVFIYIFLPITLLADSLAEEKELLRLAAVQSLIEELGLRESATPVSEFPGWSKPLRSC